MNFRETILAILVIAHLFVVRGSLILQESDIYHTTKMKNTFLIFHLQRLIKRNKIVCYLNVKFDMFICYAQLTDISCFAWSFFQVKI